MQVVRLILDLNKVLIMVDFPRPDSPRMGEGGGWRREKEEKREKKGCSRMGRIGE